MKKPLTGEAKTECSPGCFYARNKRCVCKCQGIFHGFGHKRAPKGEAIEDYEPIIQDGARNK